MVRLVAQLPPRLQIGVVTRRQQVRGISTLSEYIIPKTKRPSIKPLPLPAELNEPGVSTLACNLDKPSRVRSSHLEISPASFGWFKTKGVDKSVLRTDLFKEHGTHSLVPLEYLGVDPSNDTFTFKRFNAPLATFASFVEAPSKNFNLYLAQCDFTSFPEKLRAYLHENPRFLRKYSSKKHLYGRNIWIGLPPTYTPLHRDPNHNYFQQIAGSKTVRLMSPEMGLKVYSKVVGGDVAYDLASGADPRGIIRSEEMMVSPQREELYRAVWENQDPDIEIFEGKIEKNQSLFIPAGWWHSFKSGGTRNAKGWNTTAISGSVSIPIRLERRRGSTSN
ncbi:hypothetical protein IWX49DRAFT_595504 [Phyllosticta citricarpa]|uniref:JmjC domain-containing protein n=2 Tax=Phyllosticta TaxID=121621 RepID=A0ABR1L4C8_9PEZI